MASVNASDLSKVLTAYGQSGEVWADGDFNYDGTVNFADLSKVLANYGLTAAGGLAIGEGLPLGRRSCSGNRCVRAIHIDVRLTRRRAFCHLDDRHFRCCHSAGR